MVKGFKDAKGDFHPITQSKGVRSRRDTSQKIMGVKLERKKRNESLSKPRYKRSAKEQKLELLEPFFNNNNYVNGHRAKFTTGDRYGQFDHLPVDVAESLMTGNPNIDPNDTQNDSPKAKELVELAKKHNGTLGGYYINANDEGRDDHRITIESIFLKIGKKDAEALAKKIFPDEFDKQSNGIWRYWWD